MLEIENQLKRKPLFDELQIRFSLEMKNDMIEHIIPHRYPFLLINELLSINLEEKLLLSSSFVKEDDPVFLGHFPGNPIYPAVFQLEIMAQSCLCLSYFVKHNITKVKPALGTIKAMITKVTLAGFQATILPGKKLLVNSKILHDDDLIWVGANQIFCEDKLCSYAIMECYLYE